MYKLNFDATVFKDILALGVGVIIRNERGQVMAALLLKGLAVTDSEEARGFGMSTSYGICNRCWVFRFNRGR